MKRKKNKTKKPQAIKSGNGHKSREIRPETWGRLWWEVFLEKGKFWVWSGTEMEWCIVKVHGDDDDNLSDSMIKKEW